LLHAHPDKLVVLKFFASYCQACKILDPKFIAVKDDDQLAGLPIVWAEFHAQRHNKDLFRQKGVLTLPTIHFYDGSQGLVENFPCGPAKIHLLKKKLAQFLNARVDPETLKLKAVDVESESERRQQTVQPRVERKIVMDNELVTDEHINYLRSGMPWFKDLTDEEFDGLLDKARLLTFDPGDIIIRQGMPGTTFYVLKRGVVEMSIKSKFEDPMTTPSYYLGAVVNELKRFDYFGERALTTGEPYAASVRVLEKTRCFAFQAEDIPESSILSQKRRATREMVATLSQRYELPHDYTPIVPVTPRDGCILDLLVRFKQIRQAAKCFEYIMQSEPTWGNEGEIGRRAMLVSKLSKAQRDEFQEVFNIVDVHKRGKISLLEMRRFMDSAREKKSNDELLEMIARASPLFQDHKDYGISRDEFMGVMAEAEFYNLFTETFQELDKESTGYVRAGDLDEILGGMRDLISDEQTSIIDVEDKDMLVDYEQFSKMLLGAAL
jgi:calmodulin